ncbi:MAG: Ribonuclease R [Chlamydiae bacterium]|nr:Ribonuclease R [Chlamydiota bacterium]
MAKRPRKRSPTTDEPIITGKVRMHPRGFGFVIPDDRSKCSEDIFIPRHLTNNAVDGDTVEVAVQFESKKPEKGPEGKILSITDRARTHVAGIIDHLEKARIMAFVPILGETRPVIVKDGKQKKIKEGDRLILKIVEWGDQKNPTICEVSHKIGHITDPSVDIEAATEEYNLSKDFPKSAIQEAKEFGNKVLKIQQEGRLNLSKTPCFTIDPETAKDFDDALSISKDKKGNYFLGVHIADVAHYVKPKGNLSREALLRSNSTYFPGKCIPMLPEELSNNLCSLKQGEIRLTVSVLMQFDKEGNLLSSEVKRSFINSQKRFTYGEAKDVLDGKKKSPHEQDLQYMEELCHLLKKKRSIRGSIDFALPELVILVDKKGKPTGVKIEQYHITHQIVEEFMLKANEMVATHLEKQGKTQLFRIHEEPDAENLEEFFAMGRSLGFKIPKKPTQQDLQELFDTARQTRFSQQLAVAFIRNLKLAFYSPRNVGHYGLALEHYCHFTSPIRRYSDLVTQRLLFDEEEKDLDLDKIAEKCSEKERVSFKAEMSVKLMKKYRLLQMWMKEDPDRTYTAYVTKIKPFGFFFEVKDLFLEGFLHVSQLQSDYFLYVENVPMLEGEKTKLRYIIGKEITVRPEAVDLIHLESRWELLVKTKRKKRRKK